MKRVGRLVPPLLVMASCSSLPPHYHGSDNPFNSDRNQGDRGVSQAGEVDPTVIIEGEGTGPGRMER